MIQILPVIFWIKWLAGQGFQICGLRRNNHLYHNGEGMRIRWPVKDGKTDAFYESFFDNGGMPKLNHRNESVKNLDHERSIPVLYEESLVFLFFPCVR